MSSTILEACFRAISLRRGASREPERGLGRLNMMRATTWLVALAFLAVACGGAGVVGGVEVSGETPEIMAAALVELITEDHTFGTGPPPFTEYLIQNRIDPSSGDPTAPTDGATRPLTDAELVAIEDAISPFGAVRWIEDPAGFRTPDLVPTIEGSAILGVGEPTIEGDTGLVPVSMWCGGLCGTWLTYRLDLVDDVWVVTGIEGPIAVS